MKNDGYKALLEKLKNDPIPEGYVAKELPSHIKMPEPSPGEII